MVAQHSSEAFAAKISVVVADDHAIVRQGIVSLLNAKPDITVIGEAGDGTEAVRLVQRLRPQIALLDISMPGMNGLTAAVRLSRLAPRTQVIMLSMYVERDMILSALQAGARGYLTKLSLASELAQAITSVARGHAYLSPDVAAIVVADYATGVPNGAPHAERLTLREREILQLIAEGRTNREIAQHLSTSIKTVDTHRTHIMKRLNIHDLAGLVKYAVRTGLVEP
ncbi:MAG TPA: response regulator transcription factor [Candidatus Binatia bacterium]|nr:response regulator transcription factor [Candidatus Binatia bacterium]